MGMPVCGDPVYLRDKKIGTTQTLGVNDPPLCLHAWRISFVHPLHQKRMEFTAPPPDWVGVGLVGQDLPGVEIRF
jgi:23S rRNA-/tRNA-specific pseudouridylate synthase